MQPTRYLDLGHLARCAWICERASRISQRWHLWNDRRQLAYRLIHLACVRAAGIRRRGSLRRPLPR